MQDAQSGFQLSVVKPKPKSLLITELADNPMNQWELEENTCSRRQARKNACEQVTIACGFTSDWLIKWLEIFQPITRRSSANQSKCENFFRHSIENRAMFTTYWRVRLCFSYFVFTVAPQ